MTTSNSHERGEEGRGSGVGRDMRSTLSGVDAARERYCAGGGDVAAAKRSVAARSWSTTRQRESSTNGIRWLVHELHTRSTRGRGRTTVRSWTSSMARLLADLRCERKTSSTDGAPLR